MAFNYSPKIVTDGLVFYLDAANTKSYPGSGTTWTDISRTNINGTLTNGPTFNTANGGSIVFDGSNDFVTFGDVAALNFTTTFSIGCWFRANTTQPSVDSAIIGNLNGLPYNGYMLWYNSNTVDFYYNSGIRANSTTTIVANIWYHIMGIWTGTAAQIYLNGVLNVSTAQATGPSTGNTLLTVGRYQSDRSFAGNVTLCTAYNRALSAAEVLQNYNATRTRFEL
jgi:hypothetical protein